VKVQIIVAGQVVNTQLVSIEILAAKPTYTEVKRIALKAALEDRMITIPQSLKATFKLFDPSGAPITEPDY